jgi:hypothetical protein
MRVPNFRCGVSSRNTKDWKFSEIDFGKNTATDTGSVRTVLDKSSVAAVTFFGQTKKYYVWWLD